MGATSRDRGLHGTVLPFDWPYWEYGEPVWPCEESQHWHLELFEHPEAGETWVREWHAADCPIWEHVREDGTSSG